jgi:hypothetical protein
VFTAIAFAADASPSGTWKWSVQGRNGQTFDQSAKLDYKDGHLTGSILPTTTPMGEFPEVEIADGSFIAGVVKFTVTREFNGRTFTSKYEGKLDGDSIKGEVERPGRDGDVRKNEWNASRVK